MYKKVLFVFSFMAVLVFSANAAEQTFKELYDSAVKNYNLKKYAESLQDIDKAIKQAGSEPEKSQAFQYKYNIYNVQGKYEDAAKVADEALKLKNFVDVEAPRNQWLYNQITAYYNGGKNDECIAVCDKLIASKSAVSKEYGYHYKAYSFIRKGDYDKALETGVKLAEYAKPGTDWNCRGKIFQMSALNYKKEYDKAVAAASLTPEELKTVSPAIKAEYFNILGNIYKIQQKYPEAAAAFEKAGQADQAYHGGLGWYYLGDVYCIMDKDNDAIAAFAKVYELKGSHPHHKTFAVVRTAEILNKNGKTDEALAMLKKVDGIVGSNPDWDAKGKMLAGDILLKQDKKDDAKKQFEAVSKIKGVPAPWIKKAKDELDKLM
jgi:tetratricopeptide (TPR) repeat protein